MVDGLEMYVVYKHPTDFPDHFVIRMHTAHRNGTVEKGFMIAKEETLEKIREKVPSDLIMLMPNPNDDPKIVEVWL